MTKGSRNDQTRGSARIPASREVQRHSIERITPQNSFNSSFSVERGTDLSRRGFLRWGTLFFSLLSFLGLTRIVQAFLSLGEGERAPTRFAVGRWEDFAPGDVEKRGGVWLVREEGGLFALKGDCPHLGCGFRWVPEQALFECPCHGSRFNRAGGYLSGPARKPLQHVALTINPKGEIIADVLEPVAAEVRLSEG